MSQITREHLFVTYLESLVDDRAALAALRRGLGQAPGTAPEMHRYVIRNIPDKVRPGSWDESTYYLIASLFALHPVSSPEGNLGSHFASTLNPNPDHNVAIERRFSALLVSHPQDLHFYLRLAISFLKSKEVAVNWHQLMWDIRAWGRADWRNLVQKRWATQFWRYRGSTDEAASAAAG